MTPLNNPLASPTAITGRYITTPTNFGGTQFLTTRTETVLNTFVYSPFTHLTRRLAREYCVDKSAAIPIQAWTCTAGSRTFRLPEFLEGGEVVSPTQLPHSPPRRYSWCSSHVEAEPTPKRPEGFYRSASTSCSTA